MLPVNISDQTVRIRTDLNLCLALMPKGTFSELAAFYLQQLYKCDKLCGCTPGIYEMSLAQTLFM